MEHGNCFLHVNEICREMSHMKDVEFLKSETHFAELSHIKVKCDKNPLVSQQKLAHHFPSFTIEIRGFTTSYNFFVHILLRITGHCPFFSQQFRGGNHAHYST